MFHIRDAIYRSHDDGTIPRAYHPMATGRAVLRKKIHEDYESSSPSDLPALLLEKDYLFPSFPPLAAPESPTSGVLKSSAFGYMVDFPLALIVSQDCWPLATTLHCHSVPASCVPAGTIFYGRISHEICHLPMTASVGFAARLEAAQWPCFDFASRVDNFEHPVLPVECNTRVPGHVLASPASVLGLPAGSTVYADVVLSSDYLSRARYAICSSTETAPSASLVYNLGRVADPADADAAEPQVAAWSVNTDALTHHLFSPEEEGKPPEKTFLRN